MKKILLLSLILSTEFVFALNIDLKIDSKDKNTILDPVACCTSRASSGTYGQPNYNQVKVSVCTTSPISYQDAYARACVLADASAEKSLEIAESTNGTITIGG